MPPAPSFDAAVAAQEAGDLAEAERIYRALLVGRNDWPAANNLAKLLDRSGRTDEARELYERNAQLAPDDLRSFTALGHICRQMRDLEAAEAAYRRALSLQPEHPAARFGLGLTLLGLGRYAEGWPLNEARAMRARMQADNLPFPEWRGEPLAGRSLLIWREQGFGDQIQMARFIPRLGAAQVTYGGQAPLARLFSQLPLDYMEVIPGTAVRIEPHDYWILPMSLPAVLGLTLETIPTAPYFTGTARPSGGRVGFVWKGEAANPNQRFRAIPDALARDVLALPGVVSLAPEATGAKDFQDTADLVAGLDLVVTVDTAVAHLAGAMGKPVWVLVPAHGLDWHWLTERTDSPWYPSARLIRQRVPGDWRPVLEAVAADLRRLGLAG